MKNFSLYHAAVLADDVYQRELVRMYGQNQAGNKRYLLAHSDPAICAARDAKLVADEAWLAETRRPADNTSPDAARNRRELEHRSAGKALGLVQI